MSIKHPFRAVAITSLVCILSNSGTGEAVLSKNTTVTLGPTYMVPGPTEIRSEEPEDLRAPLVLTAVNRPSDRLEVQPYDRKGKLIPEAYDAINYFLRCQQTGRVRPIHPGTIALVYQISRAYPGRDIAIISGYRAKDNGASPHRRASAVDLRVSGVSPVKLSRELWKTYDGVAVGYYPAEQYVHVDVRDTPIRWVERGGKNQYEVHARGELQNLRPVPREFPLQPQAKTATLFAAR